jgi:hypothetical protein
MRLVAAVLVLLANVLLVLPAASGAELICTVEGDLPGAAADLYYKPRNGDPLTGKCIWAALRGNIEAGDYEKLQKLIRNSWPRLLLVDIESNGGSVYEALKIGRLLRKYLITTTVPKHRCYVAKPGLPPLPPGASWSPLPTDNLFADLVPPPADSCICASACALIWFGGIERMGTVGLHRPRTTDSDFANSPPDKAMALYRKVLSDIEGYLTEMETPRPVIDAMLATGSSEIHWINARNDHLSRPPSYAEWEDAACQENPFAKYTPQEQAISFAKYDPERGPFLDSCRGPLRTDRVRRLSPP